MHGELIVIHLICPGLNASIIELVLHIWQGYLIFSYYFMFDRILCVLDTFYQWRHFVIHIIRNLNLISIQSWTYLFNTMKVHTLHSHAYHVLLTVLFKVTLYLSFSIILNNFFNTPKQYGVLFLSWLSSMYTHPNLLYFVINVLVNIFH